MPPEAAAEEVDEAVELPEGGEAADDASGEAATPADALRAFDAKLVDDILKTSPAPPKDGKGAAEAEEPEVAKESPATAGAASDDDEESEDPAADLRAEVASLREELRASREQGKGPSALLEAAVSESPEIQQLESEMRAAEQEARASSLRVTEIIKLHTQAKEDLATKRGELKYAADVDKLDIRDEIRDFERAIRDFEREYSEKVRDTKDAQIAQKRLSGQREAEVSRIKQALANRSTQAEADKAAKREAKQNFNSAFKTEAEKYGIDATRLNGKLTDPKARHIEEVIKARVTLHLRRLQAQDPNAPAVDVRELTAKYWKDEASNRGLSTKKAFTAASTERRESRTGTTRPGARSASSNSPLSKLPAETLNSGQFWMDRAARLAGEKS